MIYTLDKMKQEIKSKIGINEIEFNVPKDRNFGDLTTNIAMKMAKQEKKNPRIIAEEILKKVSDLDFLDKVEIAGAGFINFYFAEDFYKNILNDAINSEYPTLDIGNGKSVNIEYVSANPTGPMHMGNARGGAVGDSLSRIYKKAGYNVVKEFYLNDAGNQIEKLKASLYARYMQIENPDYPFPEDGYQGEDVADLVKKYITENSNPEGDEDEIKEKLADFALTNNVAEMKRILGNYNISYDVWYHESDLYKNKLVENVLAVLAEKGATYEQDGAVWLKCEGKDEVLRRANGIPTYFAADIAYHYNKFIERKFDKAINVWGADHHGHIARMKNAMANFGVDPDNLEIVLIQLVRLMRDGEVAKMSKRTGKTISLGDLVEEIGVDPARFFFNMRSPSTHFDFDLDLATKKSSDNPVYYVQYAHARINSILEQVGKYTTGIYTELNEEEKELLSYLAKLPQEIKIIIDTSDPSRLTHYCIELSRLFHSFYAKHKVLVDDNDTKNTRLSIIFAVKKTLRACLELLGVSAPDKM